MRAASPALCAGRRRSFPRNKSSAAAEAQPRVPVLLLRDMDLCYRLLRQLVPGLQAGRTASRVEILQHVIDYILDLQTELDSSCPAGARGEQREEERSCDRLQQRLQRPHSGRTPGSNFLTCQSNDFHKKDSEDEERRTLLH
ncbi:DNA-binding protein inhibitor ID-2b [Thunnus albacares]|uniref:DNA-binding protein inhibitor ID-2b n=1 Tax=Thunnus albacares TaxID=8236 RepID=UPI001CF68FF6|nr:DNA-binding protein inhibitor ID-2b [Thunnus albacares]